MLQHISIISSTTANLMNSTSRTRLSQRNIRICHLSVQHTSCQTNELETAQLCRLIFIHPAALQRGQAPRLGTTGLDLTVWTAGNRSSTSPDIIYNVIIIDQPQGTFLCKTRTFKAFLRMVLQSQSWIHLPPLSPGAADWNTAADSVHPH